jgi:hypothetical protein
MSVEDFYEQCMRELGDREACREMAETVRVLEELRLEDCVRKHGFDKCYNLCMKKCQDSNCERRCMRAVAHAMATNKAREILTAAVQLTAYMDVNLPEAISMLYVNLLMEYERVANDCERKLRLMTLFSGIVGELVGMTGIKELTLLLAPAIAISRSCIKERAGGTDEVLEAELNELLEGLKLIVGEEVVARLSAALDEGVVKIGSFVVRFPPLRKT